VPFPVLATSFLVINTLFTKIELTIFDLYKKLKYQQLMKFSLQ
jgi:hypothetical protein